MNNYPLKSSKQLIAAQRNIFNSFSFSLSSEGKTQLINIIQVLKVLPGKRIVALIELNGKEYFLKLFLGTKRARNYQQDFDGIKSIQTKDINTPAILFSGNSTDGEAKYILFEYLDNAVDLTDILASSSNNQRAEYIALALNLVIDGYRKNIMQTDIHLGNFLFKQDELFWIDGGQVLSNKNKAFSAQAMIENLALFFAQLPISDDLYIESGWKMLLELLNENSVVTDEKLHMEMFEEQVCLTRKAMLKKYKHKVFRNSTVFAAVKSWNSFYVYNRRYQHVFGDKFISEIDDVISNGLVLKAGNTATVVKITIDNQDFVIKRYNIKSFFHGVSRFFRRSRAWHSWRNAHCLEMLGITTPEPIFLLEKRFGPFNFGEAYLLSKYTSAQDLHSATNDNAVDDDTSDNLVNQLKALLVAFRKQKISHGDMKSTNFMINNGQLAVIDLDSMKLHSNQKAFNRAHETDIARLKRNWDKGSKFRLKVDEVCTD